MDTAGRVLQATHTVVARATATSDPNTTSRPPIYKAVGIILAICSGLFIGVSFVLKKKGLLKANTKYNEAAGEGYGYLKNAMWWTGMTLMIVGEICNFVAYAFVDAILVTPLGALSVVVTTILSAIFLKERLSFVGKVGCFLCIVGSVIIVLNAPTEASAATIQEMKSFVIAPGFLSYAGVVIVGCAFVAFWAGPRYGKKSMLVYLTVCSLIGGLSVVATQGLGAAIVTQIGGTPQFNQWFLYVLLVFVICTLLTEIIFLNKALNLFNAALVTPTYYVYFTSATIVTSAILFRGFKGTPSQIVTICLGFLVICSGVILLQLAKSSKDVPDGAVFKGDLDQVRTIAEQEEPESEPRADTIRGGGALLRAISKRRTMRQAEEVKQMHHDTMEPIGEDEVVEWDGLRRRKTVLGPNQPSIKRTKTVHPPLGMSHFPADDASVDEEDDIHPGFLPRFGRRSTRKSQSSASARHASPSPVGMVGINAGKPHSQSQSSRDHVFGLPAGLGKTDGANDNIDTSYHGAYADNSTGGIHFDPSIIDHERERNISRGSSLAPPRPPPHAHGAKRQFSFQNVFHRRKSDTSEDGGHHDRPTSRGALSFIAPKSHNPIAAATASATEEERLGLVKGDSNTNLGGHDLGDGRGRMPSYGAVPEEDEEWQISSSERSESPEMIRSHEFRGVGGAESRGLMNERGGDEHLRMERSPVSATSERSSSVDWYGPPRRQTGL